MCTRKDAQRIIDKSDADSANAAYNLPKVNLCVMNRTLYIIDEYLVDTR